MRMREHIMYRGLLYRCLLKRAMSVANLWGSRPADSLTVICEPYWLICQLTLLCTCMCMCAMHTWKFGLPRPSSPSGGTFHRSFLRRSGLARSLRIDHRCIPLFTFEGVSYLTFFNFQFKYFAPRMFHTHKAVC
jgi:hypothetical protein